MIVCRFCPPSCSAPSSLWRWHGCSATFVCTGCWFRGPSRWRWERRWKATSSFSCWFRALAIVSASACWARFAWRRSGGGSGGGKQHRLSPICFGRWQSCQLRLVGRGLPGGVLAVGAAVESNIVFLLLVSGVGNRVSFGLLGAVCLAAFWRWERRWKATSSFSCWFRALAIVSASACWARRSEEHTSELQSLRHLVCRLLLE